MRGMQLVVGVAVIVGGLPAVCVEATGAVPAYRDASESVEVRVADLLGRMTLEEKIRQMDMYEAGRLMSDGVVDAAKVEKEIGRLGIGSVHDFYPSASNANALQRLLMENGRLGIPALVIEEALHGVMSRGYTVFPQSIGLATSWNGELVGKVGAAIAAEARSNGIHELLCPVLDLAREPRWGRVEETYGEDPYLASRCGVAMIRGMQGVSLSSGRNALTVPKHFAAHGISDGGRNCAPTRVGRRELHDTFLPVFRRAFDDGRALTVMSAYSEIDGVPCSGSRELLTDVLRGQWGFEGFVLSDLAAIQRLENIHRIAASPREAIRKAIVAGVDMQFYDFEHELFQQTLADLVAEGELDEAYVDRAVAAILRVKFLAGLFDRPLVDEGQAKEVVRSPGHIALAREAARQSICLLKNDGILPLGKDVGRILVVGPNADTARLGDYTGDTANAVTVLDGVRSLVGEGVEVRFVRGAGETGPLVEVIPVEALSTPDGRPGLRGEYFAGDEPAGEPVFVRSDAVVDFLWGSDGPDERLEADHFAVRWEGVLTSPVSARGYLAVSSDDGVRLWVDGRLLVDSWCLRSLTTDAVPFEFEKGRRYALRIEYKEAVGDAGMRLQWNVTDTENRFAEAVREAAAADLVIAVVGESNQTSGEIFDRTDLGLPGEQEELVEAVWEANPRTVVVLLNGRPLAIPWIAEHVPAIVEAWFPGEQGGNAVAEVLFGKVNPAGRLPISFPRSTGDLPVFYNYKPSDRSICTGIKIKPLFPFGHGLSYTTFEYSDLSVSSAEIDADESVVVRVRVHNSGDRDGNEVVQLYLRDEVSSVTTPVQRLVRFARMSIPAGASVRKTFTITPEDLQVLNGDFKWVVEPGEFTVMVGGSSAKVLTERFRVR